MKILKKHLALHPQKKGIQQLMNLKGDPDETWPWACEYIAKVNDICATPVHGWKTPISIRHGYTPDISAYLQFQFWEKFISELMNNLQDQRKQLVIG